MLSDIRWFVASVRALKATWPALTALAADRADSEAWHAELDRWYDAVERYCWNPQAFGPSMDCGHRLPPMPIGTQQLRALNDEHERQHADGQRTVGVDVRPSVGRRDGAEYQDGTRPPVLRS